jgi:PadR family transcriptional regulator, regulatory protein AphA
MSLKYAILGFLSVSPLSGYDLKRWFDNSVRHFWSADQAAIYRTLAELESEALVAHERVAQLTRPDRKLYHITPAGSEQLDHWLALPAPSVVRREPLLLKLFFQSRLSAGGLSGLLAAELQSVEAELAAFTGIVTQIEHDRDRFHEQAEHDQAREAHDAMLVGPLITLTNGVQLGVAYREWLRGLQQAHEGKALTASALLADLHRATATL